MHFFRRFVFPLALMSGLACSDSTAPPVTTRFYVLESIDGRPLPTATISGSIEVITALDGSLTLASNGSSIETTHVRDSLPQFGVSLDSLVTRGEYRRTGDSVEVGFFGVCRDICRPNRVGMYSDTIVTLAVGYFPNLGPVYRYGRMLDAAQSQ